MLEMVNMPDDAFQPHQLDLEGTSSSSSSQHETPMESLATCESAPQTAPREDEPGVKSPVLKLRLSRSSKMDVPPAFRIGLDSSWHSEVSIPSPSLISERKRSSKLADDYLEKVRTPARKKKEVQVSKIAIENLSMSMGSLLPEESNHSQHNKADNHTDTKEDPLLETPKRTPPTPPSHQLCMSTRRSSPLTDAFLEKLKSPIEKDVIRHLKKVPTLAVVKKLEGPWPPRSTTSTSKTSHDDENSISLDEIKLSLEEINKEKGQPRTETPRPCATMAADSDELTKSTLAASVTDSPYERPLSPLEADSSTLSSSSSSSPLENLRPSYKVQYTGPRILRPGREWEDGVIDASFPALPRQNSFDSLDEDHRFDPERPGSNLFFAFLPNDRRFDREKVDPSLPRPALARSRRSDRRFDPEDSGICSMPGLPLTERRRFDPNASLPCFPSSEDHRFDKEASCMRAPRIPNRSNLLPSVWQTRASEPNTAVRDRKWRLKRVWEDKQNVVVDDTEPEYVVAEPQLRAALSSLLGVPASKIQNPEMNDDSPDSNGEHPKHWKVKTVWDLDGDVVQVHDEESVDCEELLGMFERDYHRPTESIVFQYSADSLGLNAIGLDGEWQADADDEELSQPSCSHTEYIDDDDDDGSFDFDDSLHLNNSFSSTDNDANIHDPEVLKHKLREVEQEMNSLILNKDTDNESRDDARKMILLLQEKLASYLTQLQLGGETMISCEEDGKGGSGNGEAYDNDEVSISSNASNGGEHRDSKLLQKKLHKVERLMKSMVDEKGEKATKRKKYQRLETKRCQYLKELGQEEPVATGVNDGIPERGSIHYVLEKIDLEVIEEEGSLCSMEEETRDEGLLKRKLRRVEKEMNRMTAEHGDKAKSKKKYKKLAKKRVQYFAELGEPLTEIGGKSLEECGDKALNVVDGTLVARDEGPTSETIPSSETFTHKTYTVSTSDKAPTEAARSNGKNKTPKLKYNLKNYCVGGSWGSPLE
jgi:hypothetical protein